MGILTHPIACHNGRGEYKIFSETFFLQDLLMVTYLSQLVSTQLTLNENLTMMVSKGLEKF